MSPAVALSSPPGTEHGISLLMLTSLSPPGTEQGVMSVNRCDMPMLCRQVTTDQQGRVFDFNFDSTDVDVLISVSAAGSSTV